MPYSNPEEQRQYQREWLAQRRSKWFAEKTCVECGSPDDLRLDHVDPAQKVDHRIWSWSRERRDTELAKCQVLCLRCHVKKTTENGEHCSGIRHGQARYSESVVDAVRVLVESGVSQAKAAALLNVNRKSVWDMVHRRTRSTG